jgi:hypothetical protein
MQSSNYSLRRLLIGPRLLTTSLVGRVASSGLCVLLALGLLLTMMLAAGAQVDTAKTEAAKTEGAKTEGAKTEAANEAAKAEAAKAEAAKAEAAKAGAKKCSLDQLKVIGIEAKKAHDDNQSATTNANSNSTASDNASGNDNKNKKVTPAVPLALYHTVLIEVDKLPEWINQGCDVSNFILYIDGNAFPGIKPSPMKNGTQLQFDLLRVPDSDANKKAWTAVLSRRPKDWTRDVPVTVGLENGVQIPSDKKAPLTIVNWFWLKIFVVSFALAIALFWFLAYQSDIIRDTGSQPEGTDDKGEPNRKRYSLARSQMAFWFFIVVISYVFIWMVTSDLSNLTTSVLVLIGISAATGLGSAMVDSTKTSNQESKRRVAEEKKKNSEVELERLAGETATLKANLITAPPPTNLEEETANLAAKEGELAAKQAEIAQADEEIQELTAEEKSKPSKNFLSDILSDDDGVSFHRFQIFAWTIVLILIFIGSVYNSLAMPDFDTTLLALMGISGGTYLGFKLPNQEG